MSIKGGVRVERVDPETVPDYAESVDCIVLEEPGAGLEALAALDGTAVPTVLYDADSDPSVAARATRLGVTEYVPACALDDESLTDRVTAFVETGTEPAATSNDVPFGRLHDVITDGSLSFEEKAERVLDVGRQRLGLDVGFVSTDDAGVRAIETVSGDHAGLEIGETTQLSETVRRRTLESPGILCIHDTGETGAADTMAAEGTGFRCYIGGSLDVDDEAYGTLGFGSETPRTRSFSGRERRFVELLVEWLSYELERERRERSFRWYKAIHETVEQMVFLVGEGARIRLVTGPLADRFGYERGELIDEPAAAFVSDEVVRKGYDSLDALRSGADSVTIEATMETKDGTAVPVEVEFSILSSSTAFQGLVGVVRDRTELSETEAALEGERDRFQHLFDRIPDGIADVAFADDGVVIRAVNPAFAETFGGDRSSFTGRPLDDVVVPADDDATAMPLDADAIRDEREVSRVDLGTADGIRTFLVRGFAYPAGDADRGFVTYTDITERLERERRLKVLHRVLRHNLRNDMAAVTGYAELLGDRLDDPELRSHVDRVIAHAESITELGTQVQRIETAFDRDEGRQQAIDPVDVVETVAERVRKDHPEATITVVETVSDHVAADELLERAVENLLENAVVHHDGTPTVEVSITAGDEWVDITVSDDGPGIPERERAVIGGEREITQLDHSMGLGLWVTRWIVDGVGGRLRFGDRETGAAVTLRLQRLVPGESSG